MLQLASISPLNKSLSLRDSQTFKIIFDANEPVNDDIEVRTIYIGSTETNRYDQVLSEDLIGPIPCGRISFDIEINPINIEKVNLNSFFGLTSIVIMFKYRNEEFLRVGYFIRIGYPGLENLENLGDEGEEISEETNEEEFEDETEVDSDAAEFVEENEKESEILADREDLNKSNYLKDVDGLENRNSLIDCNPIENIEQNQDEHEKKNETIEGNMNSNISNDNNPCVADDGHCNLKNLVSEHISPENAEKANPNILSVINKLESNPAVFENDQIASENSIESEGNLDSEDRGDKEYLLEKNLNTACFIDTETIQYKEHIMKIDQITIDYCEPPLKTVIDINWGDSVDKDVAGDQEVEELEDQIDENEE